MFLAIRRKSVRWSNQNGQRHGERYSTTEEELEQANFPASEFCAADCLTNAWTKAPNLHFRRNGVKLG